MPRNVLYFIQSTRFTREILGLETAGLNSMNVFR